MSGISSTAWVTLIFIIVLPGTVTTTCYFQSRTNAEPSQFAGIRIGAMTRSSAAWRAGHAAALRWSTWDLVLTWLAALVCMLFLRSWQLSFALSILFFGCYLLSLALNIWHSTRVAAAAIDSQTDRPASSADGDHR